MFLYVMFCFENFYISRLEAKRIDLVLSLLICILSSLSTNNSQMFVKFSFNYFSISLICYPWKTRQKRSAYKNKLDFMAWSLLFPYSKNSEGPWNDACITVPWPHSKGLIWMIWFKLVNSMIRKTNGPHFSQMNIAINIIKYLL